jgi:hypothetical protein
VKRKVPPNIPRLAANIDVNGGRDTLSQDPGWAFSPVFTFQNSDAPAGPIMF